MKTQASLQTVKPVDPTIARNAWHEATAAHRVASLRKKRAQDAVATAEQRIKNSAENRSLTARTAMGDLGQDLARALLRLDEAEAQAKRASKEVTTAWKAWQPFAQAEADGEDAPRIPRVSHLMEQSRRVAVGNNAAERQGRADPTIASPRTPKEVADEVLAKPLAGLAAMHAGAAQAGVVLANRTDFGKDAKAARDAARVENLQRQKDLPFACIYGSCPERFASKAAKESHEARCERRTAAGVKAAKARDAKAKRSK